MEITPQVVEAPPARRARLGTFPRARVLVLAALFLILVAGAYLRFTGLDWDQDQHLHPDERFLTMVLSSLERPASIGEFFNTPVSSWNPHNKGWGFFVYGTLPIFIIRFVGEELGKTTYGEIYLVGRALSGLFDLLTVLLLFFIARRLYDTRVALLASALSAAAVLQIQQSHFMTVDTFATTFTILAFLGAVLVAQEGKLWQYVLTGAGIGMAVASRINLALLGPLAVVAAGLYLWRTLAETDDPQTRSKLIERTVVQLVLAGVVSLIAFRIFQPYAFQGPGFLGLHLNDKWVSNMRSIQAQATGEVDMPPSHQWTNRPAYLFPLSHMVLWGLGLPLGVAAWVGLALAGWQVLRKRHLQHVLPVAWVLILFAYQGQQFTKTMRYFLQIYPILAMLAAFLLIWLWDGAKRGKGEKEIRKKGESAIRERGLFPFSAFSLVPSFSFIWSPWLAGALALLVVAGTYTWAFAFTRIYTRPVSRVAASRWIYDRVPSAATVHFEAADSTMSETQVPLYLPNSVYAANGFIVQPGGIPYRASFAAVADGSLGTVTLNQIQDLENDSDPETIAVSLADGPTGRRVLATRQIVIHAEQNAGPLIVDFAGLPVQADRRYYVFTHALEGGAIKVVGRETGTVAYQTDHGPKTQSLRLSYVLETDRTGVVFEHNGSENVSSFKLSQAGTVRSITMNYLIDPLGDPEPETVQAAIAADPGGQQTLAQAQVTAHMEQTDHPRGEAYTFELPATPLEADREYFLITRALDGAPVQAWSTVIANEHWDDSVPLRMDGKDGFGMYMGFQIQNYNNDNPEKLEDLLEWLDQADYIMLTSNRLYGSIPRLPMRYPITTEYYRLLFAEQLGFKLEKTFTSYPSIGSIEIPDQSAEEAFTVYDHPKVWVFRKTEEFSRAKVRAMLADEAQGPFIFVKPIEVKKASSASTLTTLELPHDRWVRQQAAGTWSAIFNPDSPINRSMPLTVLLWLIAVEIIGLAVFPIAFVVFSRLADRGYIVSKALGLLLLAWLVWFLSSLTPLPYARWSIGLCLLVLAGLSTVIAYRQRESITEFIAENRRLLLIGEALFLLSFFAFLLVRMGNPDLWHPARGGEKPMDFAYLNAVIKSRSFPPYDPWFAGGYINYYYFGFVIVGTLIKLLGIVPATAYNLAVPTLFGLTFVGAFAVVYNLVATEDRESSIPNTQYRISGSRYWILGILGGLFVTVVGNLEEAQVLLGGLKNIGASGLRSTIPGLATLAGALQGLLKLADGKSLGIPNDWWFWNASRVMPNGEINEFPAFTFVYADLHAHMIALPITLLALAMAVQVIRGAVRPGTLAELGISLDGPPVWLSRIDWAEMAQLAVWGLIIGSLRATNTWDYPTYLLVAAGALGIRAVWRRGRIDLVAVWEAGWRFGVVVALSMFFFWPYIQNYETAYTSVQLWHGERATLGDYLTIHGFFLFIVGTFLVVEVADWWRRRGRDVWSTGNELSLLLQYGALALGAAVVGLMYLRLWVPALGLVLAVPAAVLALRSDVSPRRRLVGLLFLLGLILTLTVEFVVLKGDIGRMNTVFKFYIQVWVLWGVAAATSLAWLVPRVRRWTPAVQQVWWGAFAVLFVAVSLYPLLASRAKMRDRFDTALGPGLDGAAYMQTAVFHDEGQALQLEYDRLAIQWMQENIPGTPVVLEGQTVEYRWGTRVAIYTGLPTVVGWRWHQVQQRSVLPDSVVNGRVEDVKTIYNTPNLQQALELMDKYDVSYVYVGPLEHAYYDPSGLAKFDQMAQAGTLEQV
ncbi:MAG: DUF2298 domain-containing protein, partial [Anaerolineae bacterium]